MDDRKVSLALEAVIVIILSGVILRLAKPVLVPFFLALFLSFVLSPVLDFLTRLKIPKAVAVIFILLVTFALLYLLGVLFYSSGKAFAAEFPKYGQKITFILEALQEKFKLVRFKWDPLVWVESLDVNRIGSILIASLGPFFSFLSNLFLIFIFLIFILAGRGSIKAKINKAFSTNEAARVSRIIENIDKETQKYLAIHTFISLVTGILATAVLLAFGVDFAVVFGFLTFLLNYIPNLGSIIATILPVAIAVFQFDSLWPAFWILVLLMSVQMAMGNFVEPRLMGRGLGLSPLLVLFSLFFWGWLWGIPGMILAVPITAIIKIVCSNVPSLRFLEVLMGK